MPTAYRDHVVSLYYNTHFSKNQGKSNKKAPERSTKGFFRVQISFYYIQSMRRYICRNVEDPLAEKIIESSLCAVTQVRLSLDGDALRIDCM